MDNIIVYGDARQPDLIDSETIDCVVTSPPYFGLRSYGASDNEIGRGSLQDYLTDMEQLASNLMWWVKDTGTVWFNIGDTASGSGGAGGDFNANGSKNSIPKYKQGDSGIAKGQWCLVPELVAMIFQEQGWLLRSAITWDKGTIRPESVKHVRRPGISSERIFMFVKDKSYFFNHEAMAEIPDKGDVWRFSPSRGKRQHMAPFPDELVRRCLSLSTKPGDTVLDPFVGSGTTLRVSNEMNRKATGIDLYDFSESIEGVDSLG